MKKEDIRQLRDAVWTMCREMEETWAVARLQHLMLGLIELARSGKAWQATDIALEVSAYLVETDDRRPQSDKPAWPAGAQWIRPNNDDEVEVRVKRAATVAPSAPGATGYMNLRCDTPKPVATVEQMRAAADAAMAADEDMDEYTCDVCHKVTLVPLDSGTPKGWTDSGNPDGEEYRCVECSTFGLHAGDQWTP